MTDVPRLPLSVRETLKAARAVPASCSAEMIDAAEQWMRAGIKATSNLPSAQGLAWLREFMRDVYSSDLLSSYQINLVGEVPADVLRWAELEQLACEVTS